MSAAAVAVVAAAPAAATVVDAFLSLAVAPSSLFWKDGSLTCCWIVAVVSAMEDWTAAAVAAAVVARFVKKDIMEMGWGVVLWRC